MARPRLAGGGGAHRYVVAGPAHIVGQAVRVHHWDTAAASSDAASRKSTAWRATHSSSHAPGGARTAMPSSPWPRVAEGAAAAARAARSGGRAERGEARSVPAAAGRL